MVEGHPNRVNTSGENSKQALLSVRSNHNENNNSDPDPGLSGHPPWPEKPAQELPTKGQFMEGRAARCSAGRDTEKTLNDCILSVCYEESEEN